MRILITNDDSINAKQLLPLIRYFQKLGEVTTVVPLKQQSAKSHGIEIHNPFEVKQIALEPDVSVYAIDSTPADCVRYAVLGMGLPFDLLISGINYGYNIGTDIMYSGTVAAVREAVVQNIPAVALSTSPEYYEYAISHLDDIFGYLSDRKLLEIHHAYNINLPPNPKGIRITRQGGVYYSDTFVPVENGMYRASGMCVYQASGDLTLDTDAVMSGYISIMPLSINMTEQEIYHRLTK